MRGVTAKKLRRIAARTCQNQPVVDYDIQEFPKQFMTPMGPRVIPCRHISLKKTCQRSFYQRLKKAWKQGRLVV